ncbi:MAG: acyl-CoA thioesterase [Gemmatimonadota bacterium]
MSKHPTTRRFHVKIPVRFRDLDPMGHVNNSVYFTYLEVARTAFWQELHHDYSYDVLDFVVARAECDYVSAAMLRETIRVEVWLSRIGTTSFVLDYEGFDEQSERLIARGRTVQVMIDPKTGRPRPIGPSLRERLRSFAEHWGGPPGGGLPES